MRVKPPENVGLHFTRVTEYDFASAFRDSVEMYDDFQANNPSPWVTVDPKGDSWLLVWQDKINEGYLFVERKKGLQVYKTNASDEEDFLNDAASFIVYGHAFN